MDKMKQTLSFLAQNLITNEEAEKRIMRDYTKAELAQFIVDAFQRDWITNSNMGLDLEGLIRGW